jgi:hypothetical protein
MSSNDFVLVGFRGKLQNADVSENSPKFARCVGTVYLVIVKLIELHRLQNCTASNKVEE